MIITPKQFVHLLKNSSRSPIEQQAVLDFLSTLAPEQIQQLAQVLKRDVEAQGRLMADIEGKRDALLLQFNLEAKKMDLLNQERAAPKP